jgi:hypothetical protein
MPRLRDKRLRRQRMAETAIGQWNDYMQMLEREYDLGE